MNAAVALGETGDPRAIDPLTGALNDSDQDVRTSATEAIDKIEAVESVELGKAVINAEDTSINADAATNSKMASTNAEKPHSNAKESPFPMSICAISFIAAVLFMRLRRDRQ
jgi:HEAT repeat protein